MPLVPVVVAVAGGRRWWLMAYEMDKSYQSMVAPSAVDCRDPTCAFSANLPQLPKLRALLFNFHSFTRPSVLLAKRLDMTSRR